MTDVALPALDRWSNFYVIVGSSAGALTGLQFVVMALVAERRRMASSTDIDAFGTPTIVHFCGVLVLSAILCAPWVRLGSAATALVIVGLWGLGYMAVVSR